MFDTFFNDHKPVSEELTAADSAAAERINGLLKSRMAEISPNETKPKKRKTLKRVLWVAAAAVVTAAALGVTAAANFTGDGGRIVRVNNKRIDSKSYIYHEGKLKVDVVVYEEPCEMLIDSDGKPVTEDSDIDRRAFTYTVYAFATDDPADHVFDGVNGVAVTYGSSGFGEMYSGKAMKLPVANGIRIGSSEDIVSLEYDEKQAREFWKRYWENPEEEARKCAEFCKEIPEDDRTMCEVLKDKIGDHLDTAVSHGRITEEDREKVFEFIDENFADEIGE